MQTEWIRCWLDINPILWSHVVMTYQIVATTRIGDPSFWTNISAEGWVEFDHVGFFVEVAFLPTSDTCGCGSVSFCLRFRLTFGLGCGGLGSGCCISCNMLECAVFTPRTGTRCKEFACFVAGTWGKAP
jgi:hypothetical protein